MRYLILALLCTLAACADNSVRSIPEPNEDVMDGWTALPDSAGFQRYEKNDTLYYINEEADCLPEYTMYHGDTLVASHRAYCN